MNPKNISIADFSYDLPADRIAHYPLTERDASKLLICRDGQIGEDIYRNIDRHLPENSFLIFNNTKVVEARILFRKSTGAQIELFCLEPPPDYGGMAAAMSQTGKVRWKCLIGGASKWKHGQVLSKIIAESSGKREGNPDDPDGVPVTLEARYLFKLEDSFLIELSWTPANLSFAELLHKAGLIPLPPYIKRTPEQSDSERYQTIYARYDGSVAAPTAGLHFTEAIFGALATKHIQREFVTLHVGAGTFLPVKSPVMEQHIMHTEYISVTRATIERLLGMLKADRPTGGSTGRPTGLRGTAKGLIIPVGTTSLRTIESLYWLGLRVIRDPDVQPEDLVVHQWDAYEMGAETGDEKNGNVEDRETNNERISATDALSALLAWMDRQDQPQLLSQTQLLIMPGYEWKIADALVTNFHQPESTLLLLVAAMIGDDWRKVYQYAIDKGFRFLSYGDGCLLYRNAQI